MNEIVRGHIAAHKKKYILMAIIIVLIGIAYMSVKNAYFLYSDNIGTIVDVEEEYSGEKEGYNGEIEKYYDQTLTVLIRNNEHRGEYVTVENQYSYSQMDNTRYGKGNDVFINIVESESSISVSIRDVKRDQYVFLLVMVFIALLFIISGKQGVMTLLSLIVNIAVFIFFMKKYVKGESLDGLTISMITLFTVCTLVILAGVSKKSIGAIISSLIAIYLVYIIYELVYKFVEKPPYEMLDNYTGFDNLTKIIMGSVIIGSLGAIMDVAITINSSISELIDTKEDITIEELINSAREIGYDIMGTMVNVVFFTYISGCIPMVILRLKNGYSMMSMIRYSEFFEAARFLLGAIGIVLAIPVSTFVAIFIYRRKKLFELLRMTIKKRVDDRK